MAITEVQPPHTDDAAWSLYRDQVEDGDTHREFYDWLEGCPYDDDEGEECLGDCHYCDCTIYESDSHWYDVNDTLFCSQNCMNWGGAIACGECDEMIQDDEARFEVQHSFVCGDCERTLTAASPSVQP